VTSLANKDGAMGSKIGRAFAPKKGQQYLANKDGAMGLKKGHDVTVLGGGTVGQINFTWRISR